MTISYIICPLVLSSSFSTSYYPFLPHLLTGGSLICNSDCGFRSCKVSSVFDPIHSSNSSSSGSLPDRTRVRQSSMYRFYGGLLSMQLAVRVQRTSIRRIRPVGKTYRKKNNVKNKQTLMTYDQTTRHSVHFLDMILRTAVIFWEMRFLNSVRRFLSLL